MRLTAFALLIAASLLTGCPRSTAGKNDVVATCSAVGQSCQYAEGKLGVCVASAQPCDGGPEGHGCFVCQSQH